MDGHARVRLRMDATLDAIALLALSVWLGGFATLGAVVAPLVFGIVPLPASADAMTAVFRRFDAVSLVCAVLVLGVEGSHAALRKPLVRLDVVRVALTVLAAGLALFSATTISPHIERLHREGAVRGVGDAGQELDSVHHTAESVAKIELTLLLGALVLRPFRRASREGRADA
jgi:putative copper export protein